MNILFFIKIFICCVGFLGIFSAGIYFNLGDYSILSYMGCWSVGWTGVLLINIFKNEDLV